MAPSKQHRYDSSPSPRARGTFSSKDNKTGSDGVGWGTRAARTPVDNWIKRILDDEGNDGEDPSVDIEGVTRDIGKLREEEANGTGRGWDTDLEFTTRSMDFNHSPRLKTAGIPSRIEEIMENERSFAEDDDEEEEDREANVVKAQGKPATKDKFVVKPENQNGSQTTRDENAIRETVRAKSQERRDRLRKELKERREERRPITSYEAEDNKISQERQEGVLRNRLPRERRARSGDFSRNNPVHVEIPIRSLHNNKENIMPLEEKPLSRLERRFQGEDGLKAIQRARENRLRHEHNQKVGEDNETRPRIENSRRASENLEPRFFERAETNGEIGQMHEKNILEEEGEIIHGTPITVFSGNERRPNGPNSKQEDSLQILRNLSKAITGTNGSGGDSTGRSDNNPQARILSERSPSELEHASERFNSTPTPPPSAPIDPLLLPTPKVTGGWIETPAPPRMRTNGKTSKDQPQIKEEPSSPRSNKINLETDENGKPLSHEEKGKRLEELAFHRMNRSLKHTTSSIRDARHGIERLEQQVASSGPHSHSPKELGIPTPKTSSRPFFLDTPPDPRLNPNVHYLMIPIPRLRYPGTKKFTWFGLFFTIFITWFVAEWAMCETYCHPKYSNKDVWHPSDPFWPWAIPTKIDQWTGKVVSARMEDVWDWWQGYDEEIRIWKEEMAKKQEIKIPKIVEVGDDEAVEEVVDKSWTKGSGDKGGSSWWSWDNDEVV
ncbi:predicted protein [Sclerotinia sclerotiorum 1980 UF-70]|uniref:Uncharacterized protein n=1 Tax=Sclerotinia sclerotiorum (strain ATCC 18683 / 1980 / Ss-1) TaxID=665079 RepID=A7EMK8_SCLS1|nr:predicted protein [Sclerotinia sclerotiorum 1980 UF-70]EDO04074.1 predicted protein [Sclerotinia sclerotiorum 1980 UF-70]